MKKHELRKLAEQWAKEQRDAAQLEEKLDQLPPELRPMRGLFAAMSFGLTGNRGALNVVAKSVHSEVNARLRRSQVKRVK